MNHTCNKHNCKDDMCMYPPRTARYERIVYKLNNKPMTNTERGEWEKEFDREFKVFFDNVGRPTVTSYSGWNADDVKKYITRTIDAERAKAKAEEREKNVNDCEIFWQHADACKECAHSIDGG